MRLLWQSASHINPTEAKFAPRWRNKGEQEGKEGGSGFGVMVWGGLSSFGEVGGCVGVCVG
eukprot:3633332-Prorocentrum_lima.AAC.1